MDIDDLLHGSGLPRLDAEILLGHVLGKSRAWILAHGDVEVSSAQREAFGALVCRREAREPLAYLIGEKEFYGRSFRVTPNVLIPRPATETVVEVALEILRRGWKGRKGVSVRPADAGIVVLSYIFEQKICSTQLLHHVLDVGTGSGNIAVNLACEIPTLHVRGTDSFESALVVARENALRFGVTDRCRFLLAEGLAEDLPLEWIYSDVLKNIRIEQQVLSAGRFPPFLLVSNPPYLPEGSWVDPGVRYEPPEALFAGPEGLDVILRIAASARSDPRCVGVVLECRQQQAPRLSDILSSRE